MTRTPFALALFVLRGMDSRWRMADERELNGAFNVQNELHKLIHIGHV